MTPLNALQVGPWWLGVLVLIFFAAAAYVGWRNQNKLFAKRQSPLIQAVLSSDLIAMKAAIVAGADVNQIENNMTPLLWAVFRKDSKAVRFLLENGADPNLSRTKDHSPLWHAEIEFGATEIAELLKSHGAEMVSGVEITPGIGEPQ